VLRDLRTQLGLSRATVEQRARVGTDYMKHLESGQYPRLEASRLRRVVGVLQQAAARGQVPAPLTTRFARVVKAVGRPGKSAAKRGGSAEANARGDCLSPLSARYWHLDTSRPCMAGLPLGPRDVRC
jgi:hypothetical protein